MVDYDVAAEILVDAAYMMDDDAAAKKYGITRRTIQRYRKLMTGNDKLSQIVAVKKEKYESSWANDATSAIQECVKFLQEAARVGNRKDPDMVHAIAGAMKIMTDAVVVREVLDVRLAEYKQYNPLAKQIVTISSGQENIYTNTE